MTKSIVPVPRPSVSTVYTANFCGAVGNSSDTSLVNVLTSVTFLVPSSMITFSQTVRPRTTGGGNIDRSCMIDGAHPILRGIQSGRRVRPVHSFRKARVAGARPVVETAPGIRLTTAVGRSLIMRGVEFRLLSLVGV